MPSDSIAWQQLFALSEHERIRLRGVADALCAHQLGLDWAEFCVVLESCDRPSAALSGDNAKGLNPKGFWRSDREQPPELRHSMLSLMAFHDLQEKGLDAFLAQNNGEGWMLPEALRLADYGLGHDDRAREHQPVAARLGPRFYDWQLAEDVERSWQECAAHAELIRRIVPLADQAESDEQSTNNKTDSPQGALF